MKSDHCQFGFLLQENLIKEPACWEDIFGRQAPIAVEIGFGMGEFLVQSATENSRWNHIGLEQHWERICKTLRRIELVRKEKEVNNIRLLKVDARIALEKYFLPKSIHAVYCLFPCPWPKAGHAKHRLFSKDFLNLINNRLKKEGELYVVTDHTPYVRWIRREAKGTDFDVATKRIQPRFNTKFERKWCAQGQKKFTEIKFIKTKHHNRPSHKDIILKSYKAESFDPKKFVFKDIKGEITIIYKDMLFDQKQNRAAVHLIVSEQNLTQHFWVAIMKKKTSWSVCSMDGQKYFLTPGIAKALESVYRTVKDSNVKNNIK